MTAGGAGDERAAARKRFFDFVAARALLTAEAPLAGDFGSNEERDASAKAGRHCAQNDGGLLIGFE